MTLKPFALPPCTAAVVGGRRGAASPNAVVLCCDARFAFFTLVTLSSILANTPWRDFDVMVITDSLDEGGLDSFDRLGQHHGVEICVQQVPHAFLQAMPAREHWTGATYLRLLAPDLTQASLVLYVDSDVVVQADIADLFALPRNPAACLLGVPDEKGGRMRKKALGLSWEEPYLNGGILLIDAAQWRDLQVLQNAMALIEEHGAAFPGVDQDVLNVVLAGRKSILPATWNLQTFNIGSYGLRRLGDVDAFRGVLHFSGRVKPWMRWADPWGRALYLKYAEPLGLPAHFWLEPETLGHKLLEARAADEAGDAVAANAVRKEVIRLLLRLTKGQAGPRRLDGI